MNKLIKIVVLLFSTASSYAQINLVTRKIPLVKENTQVALLAAEAIKEIDSKAVYFSIDIRNQQGIYSFTFDKLDTSTIVTGIRFPDVLKKRSLSYFKFQNYLIFIMGDFDLSNFFKATRIYKQFKFDISEWTSTEVPKPGSFIFVQYSYFNGRFIRDPTPVPGY